MLYFTTIILSISVNAQTTHVPDDKFEQALIDLGYDTGPLDNYVPTADINGILNLDVSYKSISNLTGIEDFTALEELWCYGNELTSLYLALNSSLLMQDCSSNQISTLVLPTSNILTSLNCEDNQLTSLDVRNGNNVNVTSFDATDNADLKCIFVDDAAAAYLSSWLKDATSWFVNNEIECDAISIEEVSETNGILISPNPTNGILNIKSNDVRPKRIIIKDITGKSLISTDIQIQSETLDLTNFTGGIYFINIITETGIFTSKIIKK